MLPDGGCQPQATKMGSHSFPPADSELDAREGSSDSWLRVLRDADGWHNIALLLGPFLGLARPTRAPGRESVHQQPSRGRHSELPRIRKKLFLNIFEYFFTVIFYFNFNVTRAYQHVILHCFFDCENVDRISMIQMKVIPDKEFWKINGGIKPWRYKIR